MDIPWGSWALAPVHQGQGVKEAGGAALLRILLRGVRQWPSHGISTGEEQLRRGVRASAAPLGCPCPPLGTGLGSGRDVEPQVCSLPGAAGNCSAGASLPLGRLGISSSCCHLSHLAPCPAAPAPARLLPVPCQLLLFGFQQVALEFQLCLSQGWSGKASTAPGLSWTA